MKPKLCYFRLLTEIPLVVVLSLQFNPCLFFTPSKPTSILDPKSVSFHRIQFQIVTNINPNQQKEVCCLPPKAFHLV